MRPQSAAAGSPAGPATGARARPPALLTRRRFLQSVGCGPAPGDAAPWDGRRRMTRPPSALIRRAVLEAALGERARRAVRSARTAALLVRALGPRPQRPA